MLDEAAEFLVANDLVITTRNIPETFAVGDRQSQVLFPLVGTGLVVVVQKLRQKVSEMVFAEDQEVIKALVFDGTVWMARSAKAF